MAFAKRKIKKCIHRIDVKNKISKLVLIIFTLFFSFNLEATVLFENDLWKLERNFPYDYNIVNTSKEIGKRKRPYNTGRSLKYNAYPLQVIGEDEKLIILSYNVEKSIPKGKGKEKNQEYLNLSVLNKNGINRDIDIEVSFGAIDKIPYMHVSKDSLIYCIYIKCGEVSLLSMQEKPTNNIFSLGIPNASCSAIKASNVC